MSCCTHNCEQGDRCPARQPTATGRAAVAALIVCLAVLGALSSATLITATLSTWMKP